MPFRAFQPVNAVPAKQFLAEGIILNASSTAVQNITQLVPNPAIQAQQYTAGSKFIVTHIIFQNPSVTLNNSFSISVGWSNSITTFSSNLLLSDISTQLLAPGNYTIAKVKLFTTPIYGLPNAYLNATFTGLLSGNGSLTVDVLGYFPIS